MRRIINDDRNFILGIFPVVEATRIDRQELPRAQILKRMFDRNQDVGLKRYGAAALIDADPLSVRRRNFADNSARTRHQLR